MYVEYCMSVLGKSKEKIMVYVVEILQETRTYHLYDIFESMSVEGYVIVLVV